MYKKYVSPRYTWDNRFFKVINDELLQDTDGEIVSVSSVLNNVAKDQDNIKNEEITPNSSVVYGFVDSTKEEFISKVYDRIAAKKSIIASETVEIERLYNLLS